MTAGRTRIPLHTFLGIKPGYTVSLLDPPDGYMEKLGAGISQARIIRGIEENADIIQTFVTTKDDLQSSFPQLKAMLGLPHALWVSWPGTLSGVRTDLTTNIVREIGQQNGLLDVKAGAIDDDWSGVKFVYRLSDRHS